MDKEDLYYRIDSDEEMTDAEKRETYFSELEANQEDEYWRKQSEQEQHEGSYHELPD
jgi:hypothetical protein